MPIYVLNGDNSEDYENNKAYCNPFMTFTVFMLYSWPFALIFQCLQIRLKANMGKIIVTIYILDTIYEIMPFWNIDDSVVVTFKESETSSCVCQWIVTDSLGYEIF